MRVYVFVVYDIFEAIALSDLELIRVYFVISNLLVVQALNALRQLTIFAIEFFQFRTYLRRYLNFRPVHFSLRLVFADHVLIPYVLVKTHLR